MNLFAKLNRILWLLRIEWMKKMTTTSRQLLASCKRIVVKVGTSTIMYPNGNINLQRLEKLAFVLSDLKNQGKEVILVSSFNLTLILYFLSYLAKNVEKKPKT